MNICMCCAIYGIRYLKFVHSSTCCDGRRIIFLLNLLLFTMASVTDAQFLVDVVEKTYDEWRLIHRCTARGSNFGADIPFYSYLNNATGCASRTIPQDACNTVQKPRNVSGCDSYYAFVPRGNCQFSVKAYRVQLANYDALIVYSNPGDSPISMDGSKYKDLVKIPVVMVDYNCMERIMKSYPPEDGYQLEIRVIFGYYNLVKYLIPFVCVVVLCFIVLFMSLLFRIIRERRRDARKRLSKKNLKKLPLKKFKKGDSVETCAICLDDFIEGEKLRILPCNHVYHCKCVDPWLTKNRKVCPICKRKILFSGDSDSSDSENERSNTAGTSGTNIHENAPLIANEFIGVSSSAPRYLDDGPIYTGNSTDNPDFNADEPTTSSSIMSSTPVDRHFTIDLNADGFLNSTTGSESLVGTNSCSLPGVIRKKFHPFLHNLVNKAVRTIRKDQGSVSEVPQVDADGLQCVGNFSAENEAFDDGSETHDVSNKIDDENNDDMNAVCTSPVAVVGGTDFNDGSIYFSANEQSFPLDQSNDGETEKTLTDVSSNASFTVEPNKSVQE